MEAFSFDLQRFATGVSLNNTMSAVTFSGTANDDTLTNSGESVTINGNGGRDLIKNRNANYVLINGGNDANVIRNGYVESSQSIPGGSFVTINGGDDNDDIYNGMRNNYTGVLGGNDVLINAGAGNDFVFNVGDNVTINGGAGKNNITGYGNRLSIDVGADDDKISLSACSLVTINAGEGNNSISVDGYGSIESAFIKINVGAGNDSISVYGYGSIESAFISINAGDGDDFIGGGDNSTINAGAGNDEIHSGDNSTINAGAGNDTIHSGDNSIIDTGEGDDSIWESGSNSTINAGAGNDEIHGGSNSTINAGAGNDEIHGGNNVTIDAGAGNDTIYSGDNSTINTGEGDDSIGNGGDGSTIYTGEGDDTIDNDGYRVSINTGLGNDSVFNDGNLTTINTGAGNDTIQNIYGDSVTIDAGSGNDYIYLFHDAEKISINAGSGDDTLNNDGAFNNVTFHGDEGNDYINNSGASIEAYGDEGDDYISNGGEDVSVTGGEGSDTIYNGGEYSFIDGGNGDDYISNSAGGTNVFSYKPLAKATVTGGAGNDTIRNSGNLASLNGGDGDDIFELESNGKNATVDCTSGNDTIKVNGENVFALVGFGLGDVIEMSQAANNLILYAPSFNDDRRQVVARTGGIYTEILTLDNVNSLEKEQVTWQLDEDTNSATAVRVNTKLTLSADKKHITYEIDPNDEPEEIFTISGLKAGVTLADLQANVTVDDTQVTVNEKVLGNSDVTISDGYTLALASTVPKPKTTTNECNISSTDDTSTVIYTAGGATGGYTLDDNKIVYGEGTGGTFKLTGLAKDFGADDMTVDGKQIFLSANALGNSNVTLTTDDDYTLALDDDCPTVTAFDKGWKLDGTTATLHNAGKTDGYRLMTTAKAVTYLRATGGKALLTVSGLSDGLSVVDGAIDGLTVEDKKLTVTPDVVGENFSVSGGYKVVFAAGDYSGSTFTGTTGKDTLEVNGNGLIVDGGAGNDKITSGGGSNTLTGGRGNDTFVAGNGVDTITDYGVGTDKISIASSISGFEVKGDDVIIGFDDDKSVTIADGAGKKIYFLQNGRSSTEIFGAGGKMNTAKTSITLNAATDNYTAASTIITIDGSLTEGVNIVGNAKSNKIFGSDYDDTLNGGTKNATLTGGNGSDIFVYETGKIVISDYVSGDDRISLGASPTAESLKSNGDVFLKFGSDSLTIKKVGDTSSGRTITFTGEDGDDTTKTYFSEKIVGDDGVTLTSSFAGNFTADGKVDASSNTKKITLTGGENDDTLIGGKGTNVLDGNAGDDILIGNGGADTFVYSSGDDTITDYESKDKISLTSAIQSFDLSGDDVIIGFGDGSLTIADAANSAISFVETTNGKVTTNVNVFASDGIFNKAKTVVTLKADASSYTAPTNVVSIDGGLATDAIEIVGNSKSNKIHAGDNGSTIDGGSNNDSLWGGNGSDTFIYSGGNDVIYGFGDGDALNFSGDFTASVKGNSIAFKVGSTANAVTLKDYSATTFNVNGETYAISGSNFVKK